MLQKEFENLIGREINATENFNDIHHIYMATNMEKQQFAAEWKKPNHGCIMVELAKLEGIRRTQVEGLREEQKADGYLWADEAHEMSSGRARERAIQILGFKEYINYVISKDWNLWTLDKQEILNRL